MDIPGRYGMGGSVLFPAPCCFERRLVRHITVAFSCICFGVCRKSDYNFLEGRGWSCLNDGRCPHDVDALRCLYIPPLSTLEARSLRTQIILYCYRWVDLIFYYWEARSAGRRSCSIALVSLWPMASVYLSMPVFFGDAESRVGGHPSGSVKTETRGIERTRVRGVLH